MAAYSVSVALCTYEGSGFLREQLESIAWQTRPPEELVICDDGSQDETLEILTRFSVRAPFPVRIQTNEANLGTTRNFEQSICLCQKDLIVLCDQDDVWRHDKLERIEAIFARSLSIGGVFSDANVVDEQLRPLGYRLWDRYGFTKRRRQRFAGGRAFEVLLDQNAVTGATLAFRSSLRDLLLPIPPCWMHDAWIAIVIAATSELTFVEEPLIQYRQHARNQIGGRKPSTLELLYSAMCDNSPGYRNYVTQLRCLRERLSKAATLQGKRDLDELDSKIVHFQARADMPRERLQRIPKVLRELLTLRYFRYSNGGISMFKDCFLQKR